jgi:hypothetical protein
MKRRSAAASARIPHALNGGACNSRDAFPSNRPPRRLDRSRPARRCIQRRAGNRDGDVVRRCPGHPRITSGSAARSEGRRTRIDARQGQTSDGRFRRHCRAVAISPMPLIGAGLMMRTFRDFISTMLFGVGRFDVLTLAAVSGMLVIEALVA